MVTTTVYTSESGVSNKVKGYKSDFISSTKNVYIIYPGMRSKKEYITEVYGDNKTSGTAVVETLLYDNRNHIRFRGNEAIANANRLEEIRALEKDWNGYGACSFSDVLVDKCKRIISQLSHQPTIYPTGRRSIQMQYELADRSYLEFEVFEDKVVCLDVPKRIYSNAIQKEFKDSEEERIKEYVNQFYGEDCTER